MPPDIRLALVTGASRGLGLATATALARRGLNLIVDGRDPDALAVAVRTLEDAGAAAVIAVAGDVTDPGHRTDLAAQVKRHGPLALLVNNASELGPSPLPRLADLPHDALTSILACNVVAPLALVRATLPALHAAAGAVINVTSDAAVEAYEGWGGYGASKAALDQASAVLAVEEPTLAVYAFDPGDLRTAMHQAAFPGEDISDHPLPETVVPALLGLLDRRPPSGRYRATDLLEGTVSRGGQA